MTLLISCYFHTFLAYFHITDYCIIAGLILYQFLSRPELLACVQIQINKIKKKKKTRKKNIQEKKIYKKIFKDTILQHLHFYVDTLYTRHNNKSL